MSRTKKRFSHPRMKNMIVGRDFFHLEHVTNGIRGGFHGGDKKSPPEEKEGTGKTRTSGGMKFCGDSSIG